MKIGILGAADVAFRRFLPALAKCSNIAYAGVATRTAGKALCFQAAGGGKIYESYDALLADEDIDSVYVPLPPALHFMWGKKVLEAGKHLLMEKPFCTTAEETAVLLELAQARRLAAYENYMFLHHSQVEKIKMLIADGDLGELRLLKISFGFPKRGGNDFRYQKNLGGGALLDCGGYTVRLASEFLKEDIHVAQARLCQPDGYSVDLFGSAVLEDAAGLCAQISFGMDNAYQCGFEAWGSKATLTASRIFTAGPDICPRLALRGSYEEQVQELPSDDQFLHSIEVFAQCAADDALRKKVYTDIWKQAGLVDQVRAVSMARC